MDFKDITKITDVASFVQSHNRPVNPAPPEPDNTPELSATVSVTQPPNGAKGKPKFNFVRASAYLAEPPPDVFLVDELLTPKGIAVLFGESDSGKSTLLKQLSLSVITGNDFLGRRVTPKHRSVIYISTEDSNEANWRTIKSQSVGIAPADLDRLRFAYEPAERKPSALNAWLTDEPADVVIMDCYSDVAASFDTNSNNATSAFLEAYQSLANKHDCLFIFLHHSRKGAQNNAAHKDNMKGSSRIQEKARVVLELKRNLRTDNGVYLSIAKANNLANSAKKKSFVLELNPITRLFDWHGEMEDTSEIETIPPEDLHAERNYQIMRLYGENRSYEYIANELGVSSKTIAKVVKTDREANLKAQELEARKAKKS